VIASSEGLGKGSEFLVTLPVVAEAKTDTVPKPEPAAVATDRRPKVLVVDDNRDAAESLEMVLGHLGAQVQVAYDGREALELMERDPTIALVLLDVMMPYMTGLDVLAKLRADDRWRNVPAIVLTAAGQEQHHKQAMELGANEFLTKPFSPKKLYARAAELTGVPTEGMGVPER
jgi:two-component system alkaline phosphatase synthesis response regulator PhoP